VRADGGARLLRVGAVLVAAVLFSTGSASPASAQFLSNLEPDRPLSVEDASPIPYRAISAALDWTYNVRRGGLNDEGPGWTVLYGAYRRLEVGATQRYVTRPGRNALRGISSGDLELHALYGLVAEGPGRPAIAGRVGVIFPTGLDSRGTDLQVGALLTRSFDAFRLHANFTFTRLSDTIGTERADRLEGGAAVDFLASRRGRTDTILMAAVSARSNPLLEENAVVEVELGGRHRIWMQSFLFVGLGTEISEQPNRPQLRARVGISHAF
jgi:hypothetical protein